VQTVRRRSRRSDAFVHHESVDQLVDIAGDAAVIHGVNTLIDNGKVLAPEHFTDVFVLRNRTWAAISAQETTLG
jgi:hypothetical protein